MSKIKRLETSNPAFEGDVIHTVDPLGGHSSEVPSTDHFDSDADHAQFDDAEDNISPKLDPNISGTPEMTQMHSEKAGPLNGWKDNDSYREFLQTGEEPESALQRAVVLAAKGKEWPIADGDYDDNHGIPSPTSGYMSVGDPYGGVSDYESGGTREGATDFPVDVVQRRI